MKTTLRSLVLALLTLLMTVYSVSAEGPGTGGRRVIIDDDAYGPYLVRVVTSPTPPRVENLYVEVRVVDAATGKPVTDTTVSARAELTEGQAPVVETEASHDIAPIPTEYAAHLPVEKPGVWRVTVTIENEYEVDFLIRVGGSTTVSTIVAVGLPVAGLALLVGVFLYLQRMDKSNAE